MNKYLEDLIALAQVDREIDGFTPQLEAIEKKLEKIRKKIEAATAERDALAGEIDENKEKIKAFEEQIKLLNDQLAQHAKKAKEITTEKEMKALAVEEDIAKEKIGFANEEIERLGKVNETKEALLQEAEEKLKGLNEELEAAEKESAGEREEIEKAKAELFEKRQELGRALDQKVLSFYEKIRAWAGNSAVVPVKKQACYGCYMKINDKTYAEVIKGEEIATCSHCGRILYIEKVEVEA